jgi:galactonate dehydratase
VSAVAKGAPMKVVRGRIYLIKAGNLTPVLPELLSDEDNAAFEKVKALREAVGPHMEIMTDPTGGVTTDETIRLCRRFEELNLLFVEEPAGPI